MTSENMQCGGDAVLEDRKIRGLVASSVKAIETGQNDELIATLQKRLLLTQEETNRILASTNKEMPFLTLEALLDHGWDINEPRSFTTPPFLSRVIQNEAAVRWFLDHGADPNAYAGTYRCTSLSWAVKYSSLDIIKLLFEHNGMADCGELVNFAVQRQPGDPENIPILEYILSKGAPPDHVIYEQYPNLSGLTMFCVPPLSSCATYGDIDAIRLLIQYGADLWKPTPLGDPLTAIDLARKCGQKDIVDMLHKAMQAQARL